MTQLSPRQEIDQLAKDLEALADAGIDHAKATGVDDIKLKTSCSFSKRLVVEANEFTLANSLQSRNIGLAVHKDKKEGSATFNTATEDAVKKAVDDARTLAQFSVADEYITMASADEAPPAKPLSHMWQDSLAAIDLDGLQATMKETLAILRKDKRVALDKFEFTATNSWHGLYNSRGVRQSESQTMANWYFFGMARDGDQVSGFDYNGSFAFGTDGLRERMFADAEAFAKKIVQNLNPVSCPTYKGAILLTPRAVQELLTGTILFHASGRQVMDGRSQWDQSVGTKVMSEKITFEDDPHSDRFSGCTSYDRDGMPTKKRTLVEKGVLTEHLLSCYTANRLGKRPNASAGSPFAMRIAAGSQSLEEMRGSQKQLLVVDRFSGNTDPLKGDFSGVAKSSRLIEGGEDRGAVTETMIAGNSFELLKNVISISKTTECPYGSFESPYILVDGVSVTGR